MNEQYLLKAKALAARYAADKTQRMQIAAELRKLQPEILEATLSSPNYSEAAIGQEALSICHQLRRRIAEDASEELGIYVRPSDV